jgi:hypothetical protein
MLAQSAVRAAVDRLEGHVAGATDTVLQPRLVIRGSTSPPGRELRNPPPGNARAVTVHSDLADR